MWPAALLKLPSLWVTLQALPLLLPSEDQRPAPPTISTELQLGELH